MSVDPATLQNTWRELKEAMERGEAVSKDHVYSENTDSGIRVTNTRTHTAAMCGSAEEAARRFISMLRQQ